MKKIIIWKMDNESTKNVFWVFSAYFGVKASAKR